MDEEYHWEDVEAEGPPQPVGDVVVELKDEAREAVARRIVSKEERERAQCVHRCHALCLLARGVAVHHYIDDAEFQGLTSCHVLSGCGSVLHGSGLGGDAYQGPFHVTP